MVSERLLIFSGWSVVSVWYVVVNESKWVVTRWSVNGQWWSVSGQWMVSGSEWLVVVKEKVSGGR